MADKPTIKGIFVNSHIKALREAKGQEAVDELAKRFAGDINFANSANVFVSDEVRIIEICLDIMTDGKVPDSERAFEAGKLHFKNFSTTPLAQIIFTPFKNKFKTMMLNADKIAGHVFRGVEFSTEELGEKAVKITMRNNDYPIDHFKGLFSEWLSFSGLKGTVKAEQPDDGSYQYTLTWE